MISDLQFTKLDTFQLGLLGSDQAVVPGTEVTFDTDKLIIDSTLVSRLLNYIFDDKQTDPRQVLSAILKP